MIYFHKNIKVLRNKAGYTQKKLGELLGGKSHEVVSSYEKEKSFPTFETLVTLVEIFDVSLDDLVFRNIEKQGTSGNSSPASEEAESETLIELNRLMKLRIRELEREIKVENPGLAEKLGIE